MDNANSTSIDPTKPLPDITAEKQEKISKAKPMSWKPGQSGNPKGRPPKEWTWAGELEKAVEEMTKDGRSVKHHVARSLVRESLSGNVQAIRELMNRMDGMPLQATDITSMGEKLIMPHVSVDTKPEKDNP